MSDRRGAETLSCWRCGATLPHAQVLCIEVLRKRVQQLEEKLTICQEERARTRMALAAKKAAEGAR